MVQKKSLGKLTFLLFVAGAISLAGIQTVTATEDKTLATPCPKSMKQDCQMSKEMLKVRDAFLKDTKELRRNMMVKRSEMRAMMQGTNPDPKKVSTLAGEIFDLREQLRVKAGENGLPGLGFMGHQGMRHGCNMMQQTGGPMMDGPHHQGQF